MVCQGEEVFVKVVRECLTKWKKNMIWRLTNDGQAFSGLKKNKE